MRIDIDIDNTLSHTMRAFIPFLNKKHNGNKTKYNLKDAWTFNLYHTDFKEFYKDWSEFVESDDHIKMDPIEHTIDVLKELYKKHDLYIITARPTEMKEQTILWLDKHFKALFKEKILLEYKTASATALLFTKYDVCKKLNIDLIIEDSLETAIECSNNNIKAILYNHENKYNWQDSKEIPNKIIRTTSWKDIKKEIEKMEK